MIYLLVFLLAGITHSLSNPIHLEDKSSEINGRIIGGQANIITDFPYIVSLMTNQTQLCSGAIIGKDVVLTAAHCVSPKPEQGLWIRAGSTYWDNIGDILDVVEIKVHEKYDPNTFENDVAVLRLNESLSYGQTISKIDVAQNSPENGTEAGVCGWGLTTPGVTVKPLSLHCIRVYVIGRYVCSSPNYLHETNVKFGMICAAAPGRDACNGDDGSPLVADGLLVGIYSWNSGCANDRYPGVYVDVANYRKWIDNAIKW